MAHASKEDITKKRQANLIDKLKKKETIMKWGLIAAGIIVLLLLLYIGYATDWMRGLKTSSGPQSVNPSLDSATAPTSTDGVSTNDSTTTNRTTPGGTTTTNGGSTNTTTNNNTTRENSSTTTNNTTTTTPAPSSNLLLDLYAATNVGDTLDTVLNDARNLGATTDCADALLIRTCTITLGDTQVQVRGLLNTGLVTSVLNL